MFGYLPKPTFISLFSYFGYWGIVLFCIGVKLWRGTLTDATKGKGGKKGKGDALAAGGEGEDDEGAKKPAAAAAALSNNADDSALESSSGSEQDLPSAAPYLLPVVHKHLPHFCEAAAGEEQQPKADVETGAAANPVSRKSPRWWQRGKKE